MQILLAVLMFATWTTMFSFGKIALALSPPLFLTGFRMVLAGVLLLGYLLIRKRSSFKLNRQQVISLVLLGFFSIYLTNSLEFWGLQHLSAAKTCFLYSLSPFFAAFFSYLHFKEKINLKKAIGLSIGFLGIIPVLFYKTGTEEILHAFSIFSWPELALIGAVLCSVYGWVLLRLVVKNQTVSPSMANGSSMLIGGMFAFIHSFFVESWTPTPVAEGQMVSFLQIVLLMTGISNILCYNLYGMMLKRFTATFLSFVGLLSPIFASISGWVFLGEPISWVIALSTSVVCLGLWLVYQAELKQGYIVKKSEEKTSEAIAAG
ncbi:MAG: EamA family transporter [Chlamydiae bacterium]|nr:EamA family transporter [Chlamydiota bacterium]